MAAREAELVDHILPHVPVRQWVLSLPHALRYRLAWDHALCRAVLTIYTALLGFERRRARRRGIADGRSRDGDGDPTIWRRGVQLNVHYQAWADLMRRVFALDVLACAACGGRLRFLATIEDPPVVTKILAHLGLPSEVPRSCLPVRLGSPTSSTSPNARVVRASHLRANAR